MQALKDLLGRTTPVGKVHGVIEYLQTQQKGISGDMVLAVSPAVLGSSAAAVNAAIGGVGAKFTRQVTIKLQTAAGDVHTWFSGSFAIAVAETSAAGNVAIAGGGATANFVDGVATVTLEYTGAWVAADTQTLTITGGTKLGYAIANKTSVDTLVA